MNDEERKALVERLREIPCDHDNGPYWEYIDAAANHIEADGKRIAELEVTLRDVIECDPGSYEATIARAALGEQYD